MSTETIATYTEAPASFTVKLQSPDGYDCLLTLRGTSGADLLPKVGQILEWVKEHGYAPTNGHAGNGQAAAATASSDPDVLTDDKGKHYKVCQAHDARMYAKTGKGGQVWYSHQTASGDWCKGKAN